MRPPLSRKKKKKKKRRAGPFLTALQYRGFRLAVATLGRLPAGARSAIGSLLGGVLYRVAPARRDVIETNLGIAFPEWSSAERERVIRACYSNLVRNSLDVLALARATPEQVLAAVATPRDGEILKAACMDPRGTIIVTGHTGNWEWGGAVGTAIGMDIADVAKPQHNAAGDRFVNEIRERFGIKLISTRENPIRIVRHLKKGGILTLFSDQDAGKDGLFVPFFGRMASTVTGAAYFAWRLGAPIVPMWGYRTPEGKLRFQSDDAILADPSAPMEAEIERITRLHVACLERAIRRDPTQYFWFHRRWKTRPPGEPPVYPRAKR